MEWEFLEYHYQKKCNGENFRHIFIHFNSIFFCSYISFLLFKKNIEEKNYNRNNINEIINEKISNLPILENNTNNVIEFNDGFSNQIKDDRPRSFRIYSNQNEKKAIIISLQGKILTKKEKLLISQGRPWG